MKVMSTTTAAVAAGAGAGSSSHRPLFAGGHPETSQHSRVSLCSEWTHWLLLASVKTRLFQCPQDGLVVRPLCGSNEEDL